MRSLDEINVGLPVRMDLVNPVRRPPRVHPKPAAPRCRTLRMEHFESRSLLTTVTLTPVADNTIYQDAGNLSNGAGQFLFSGQASFRALARRALLKFDVASAVPAGAHINSVALQ